jgi:hypothetical protein
MLINRLINTTTTRDFGGELPVLCNEIIPATMLNQAAHAKKTRRPTAQHGL